MRVWDTAPAAFAVVLVLCVCTVYADVCHEPVELPTLTIHPFMLGDTKVNISVYMQPGREGQLNYQFLNLHENENTSVVAAKALLYQKGGGSIVYLQHGGERMITFMLNKVAYTFDPNRMFTPEGVAMTLQPFNDQAAVYVSSFAQAVLDVYNFTTVETVIALHNNSPNYSALDYLPGQVYANDAEKVHIGRLFTPRDFFYIADTWLGENLYNCLTAQEFSAVLQANDSVTNDGSLSVYCMMQQKPYVNVEAAAEGGSTGDAVINQLVLLDHLTTLLESWEHPQEGEGAGVGISVALLALIVLAALWFIHHKWNGPPPALASAPPSMDP